MAVSESQLKKMLTKVRARPSAGRLRDLGREGRNEPKMVVAGRGAGWDSAGRFSPDYWREGELGIAGRGGLRLVVVPV